VVRQQAARRWRNAGKIKIAIQKGPIDRQKADSVFSGITTFARLGYVPCLATDEVKYDIAFIGMIEALPSMI
jgi:hypothetical protein